jgi:hypothetical protein
MSTSERYRSHAAECVRLANHATSPGDKALLLQLAKSWILMSERVAVREDTDASQAKQPAAKEKGTPDQNRSIRGEDR